MENITEVVDSPQENVSVENVSTDDLRNLLNQTTEAPQETAENQPETVEALEPNDQVTEMSDQAEPVEELPQEIAEDGDDRLAKRRIRPRNDQDQQVIDLYRSEGFDGSFADASRIIYGQAEQKPISPEVTQPSEPTYADKLDEYINKAQGEIQELNAKVHEAAENMDTAEAIKLQHEIMDRRLNVQKAESKKDMFMDKVRTEVESTQRHKSMESRQAAVHSYPELDNENSLYRKEFDNFIAQTQGDPDYAPIFNSPRWPEMMAREFAAHKGVQPSGQSPVEQAAVNPPRPQIGNQSKVLTSGGTSQPINAPTQQPGEISNLSNDQLYSLLGTPDGQRVLR
jgi:hypothetical protein